MEELLRLALGIAVFVLMLGVGMDCTPRDIRRSAIRPSLLATVTAIQFLCIPAIVLGTEWILGLSTLVTTGLLLVSACPSGTISNGYTFLTRGNSSLSVTFTTVSNLVAIAATPLALAVASRIAGAEITASLAFPPGPLLGQLFVTMLTPLAIGAALRAKFPDKIYPNLKFARASCLILILAVVAITVLANPPEIGKQLRALILPVIIITPCLVALAVTTSKIFRLEAADQRAIIFELPCRNVALAMLISLSVLHRPDLVFVAMAFFILESLILLPITAAFYRQATRGSADA